jgi:YVTN family beta-propeller protein
MRLTRLVACCLAVLGSGCRSYTLPAHVDRCAVRYEPMHSSPLFAYVANGGSNTISGYRIGSVGDLTPLPSSPVATGAHPKYLATASMDRFLYVANVDDQTISEYSIDQTSGQLTELPGSPVNVVNDYIEGMVVPGSGAARCGSLYVATRFHGIWQFGIAADGRLVKVFGSGTAGLAEKGPIAYRYPYFLVTDVSNNSLSLDGFTATGNPIPIAGSDVQTGGGEPAAITTTPDGRYAYVANRQSNDVSAFAIDDQMNRLTLIPAGPSQNTTPLTTRGEPVAITAVDIFPGFVYVAAGAGDFVSELPVQTGGTLGTGLSDLFSTSSHEPVALASALTGPGEAVVYIAYRASNRVEGYMAHQDVDPMGPCHWKGALCQLAASVATGSRPEAIAIVHEFTVVRTPD